MTSKFFSKTGIILILFFLIILFLIIIDFFVDHKILKFVFTNGDKLFCGYEIDKNSRNIFTEIFTVKSSYKECTWKWQCNFLLSKKKRDNCFGKFDRLEQQEKTKESIESDLFILFKDEASPFNQRQIICRNGKIGIEYTSNDYVYYKDLNSDQLNTIKENLETNPFYYYRNTKEDKMQQHISEFVYYGNSIDDMKDIKIKYFGDYYGNINKINEATFVNKYTKIQDVIDPIIISKEQFYNLADTIMVYPEQEFDYKVKEWPFKEINFVNVPLLGEGSKSISIPAQISDQVEDFYNQTSDDRLCIIVENEVLSTLKIYNNIHYSKILEWDTELLGFEPDVLQGLYKYELKNPKVELLEVVKKYMLGDNNNFYKNYYYKNPETGETDIYKLRLGLGYSSLKSVAEFCK